MAHRLFGVNDVGGTLYSGILLCNVSIVALRISLNTSSFKTATRFFIRLMCAVNNLFGRAKLIVRNDP